jgi:GntR family transcriptional regulator
MIKKLIITTIPIWEFIIMQKDNRLPLYYQLMDRILEQIEQGKLKEHERLPSERELCDMYDISRTTVRQTMQELEKEGYIYKKHGKGSFISPKVYNQSLVKFYSFTEEMKKSGKVPSSIVVSFQIEHCDSKIAKKMNINPEDKVYKITRLRLADKEPMLYETSYVPLVRFEGLSKEELEGTPMYDLFRNKYQATITRATEVFKAVATRDEEAQQLNIEEGVPSLMLERTTYENSTVIEYTVTIARGDKFSYTVELK